MFVNKDIKFKELIKSSFKGITPKYVEKSSIMVLNQKCIRNNAINYSLAQYHSDDKAVPENKFLKVGDILINSTGQGTAGRCAFVKELPENQLVTIDSHILVVRMSDFYTAGFAEYHLYNIEKLLQTFMDGSTGQGEFDKQRLYNVFVRLPSENRRKSIYELLSEIDEKIALNNQINATLEQMAKTLYDYWFVQFDFPDDNGKPYKSSGGEMVYNKTLKRDIPKGWEIITLGKITICHDSKRVPLSSQQRLEKQGEYPYYGATGIFDFIDDYIFDGDYVLMAEDGSVMDDKGNPILQRIYGKTWVNNHAHVLEPISDYTCYLLMLLLKDVSVKKIKTGSIQMKINQENMNNIPLVSIPEDLKNKINNILLDLDKQLISIKKQNIELIKLRDWLLPMLMNGQVTVQ